MPILFRDAGLTPSTAALITALFPLGGLGAIFSGWLMDRFNANIIIAVCFALTAAAVYAIGQSTGSVAVLTIVVLVAGTLMNTAQSSLPARAGRGLDAGSWPLRRHCGLVSCRRVVSPQPQLR